MAKQLRGFALMSAERRREAASKGGRAQGKRNNPGNFAHDPQRAVKAGAKGGKAKRTNKSL
jgi:general stress protein YciG